MAHKNEYDLDSPDSIDFDLLVEVLEDLKAGQVFQSFCICQNLIAFFSLSRRVEIPVYSFTDHQRLETTTQMYSPHVLILEGIFALYDQRVLNMLDMKIFAEADADICLSRRSMSKYSIPIKVFPPDLKRSKLFET